MRDLATTLDPASCHVDQRDHRDRLAFAADFAQLILYYDKNNQVAGDWRPFFLKDPTILLATISKTDYATYHAQFTQAKSAQKAMSSSQGNVFSANQVCDLLTKMLVALNDWFHFMCRDASASILYDFLNKEIQTTLSSQLWAMAAAQQQLYMLTQGQITPFNAALFDDFEAVWTSGQRNNVNPDDSITVPTLDDWLGRLDDTFHAVFDVFVQVIEHAEKAFYVQENLTTPYPDMALLMAFSRLMEMQQSQINQLGRKHLDFYYDQVLQQTLRPAQADQVLVCLALPPKGMPLLLPAQTAFSAGTYSDNSDIVFVNDEALQVNHAAITLVRTLYYQADTGVLSLTTVADANQVKRNPAQEIRSWDGFGNADGLSVQQGFAIASPMLLLQGGKRRITITFQCAVGSTDFAPAGTGTRYYLSTELAWLEVLAAAATVATTVDGTTTTLQLDLPLTTPAIVAFKQGPDGVTSPWPMLKVVLGGRIDLCHPPLLHSVTISVEVSDFSQMTMANDIAVLPITGAAQIFGPIPALGDCVYFGSAECFSKPLSALSLTMHWDHLPPDLALYYASYNDYLAALVLPAPTPTKPKKSIPTPLARLPDMFQNTAFTGEWKLLNQRQWQTLAVAPSVVDVATNASFTSLFQAEQSAGPEGSAGTLPGNRDNSQFAFSFPLGCSYTSMPELACAPLPAPGQAENAYLRFQLKTPLHAFGHDLYAKVLADISFQNAEVFLGLAKKKANADAAAAANVFKRMAEKVLSWFKPKVVAPAATNLALPNVPYSPKQATFLVSYTASQQTEIASSGAAVDVSHPCYPFELYHYGSFQPYLAYDARTPERGYGFTTLTPTTSAHINDDDSAPKLPLFSGVGGIGCLYIALSGVNAPGSLSLLVEVVADAELDPTSTDRVSYHYWSKIGWSALNVLKDETNQLRCSGIIIFDIPTLLPSEQAPAAAALACPIMPSDDFWLAIACKGSLGNVKISYLNTQALRLRRSAMTSLPSGTTPVVDANVISVSKTEPPLGVIQPFPSFGGLPCENRASFGGFNSYYRRVSRRLNHKDRASSTNNYIDMAFDACSQLYFAKRIKPSAPGTVRIGLVNSYCNAQLVSAFRPLVGPNEQTTIQTYLASRIAATVKLSVFNLRHQIVQLRMTLVIASGENSNALVLDVNQKLRLYLSPWITSDLPQMDLVQGLNRSALMGMLNSLPQIISVPELTIYMLPVGGSQTDAIKNNGDPVFPSDDDTILVTAEQHQIVVTTVPGLSRPTMEVNLRCQACPVPPWRSIMDDKAHAIVDQVLPDVLNFEALKNSAIKHLKSLTGDTWTNYNASDPGVTILNQLCYALTELAYCADFPIEDVLTAENGEIAYPGQFFEAPTILTSAPVTIDDYRKLVHDRMSMVQAIYIVAESAPLDAGGTCCTGRYSSYLCVKNELTSDQSKAVFEGVYVLLNQHRNLGELFLYPTMLKPKAIALSGTVNLTRSVDATAVYTQIMQTLREYETPLTMQSGYQQLRDQGLATDLICNGPQLQRGWIAGTQAFGKKCNRVNLFDLNTLLTKIEGVSQLASLNFVGQSAITAIDIGIDEIPALTLSHEIPALTLSPQFRIMRGATEVDLIDDKLALRALLRRHQAAPVEAQMDLYPARPHGRNRQIETYYSVQNTFPDVYGIGYNSLDSNSPDYRVAASRQLKGYLMVYDQLLANQFSQLAHVSQLFSFPAALLSDGSSNARLNRSLNGPLNGPLSGSLRAPLDTYRERRRVDTTYYCQPLYTVPGVKPLLRGNTALDYQFDPTMPALLREREAWKQYQEQPMNAYMHGLRALMESESEALRRRDAMLSHLMARHGDEASQYDAMIQAGYCYGSAAETRVIIKSIWLQNYERLSYARNAAYGYAQATPLSLPSAPDATASLAPDATVPLGALDVKRQPLTTQANADGALDQAQICANAQLTEMDFINFSTFELKVGILLGLPAHLLALAQTLVALITQPDFDAWTKLPIPDRKPYALANSDVTLAINVNNAQRGMQLFEGTQCVMDLDYPPSGTPSGSLSRADYQSHADQLLWLARQRQGFLLIEHILLLLPLEDGISPYFLQASMIVPSYVTRVQQPVFQTFIETLIELHAPAHIGINYVSRSKYFLSTLIQSFVPWHNNLAANVMDAEANAAAAAVTVQLRKLLLPLVPTAVPVLTQKASDVH